ncbi:MAG: AAA family ATPase [Patescibacteria group bacterium]
MIIGFEKNADLLNRAAAEGQLNHAYLFTGQEMLGKRTFALALANRLNGTEFDTLSVDPVTGSASGQTIGIGEIRQTKSFLSLKPIFGDRRFVIINDAHLMTDESQNALLKILEEPGPAAVIILVTANPEALLPTVVSRCQEMRFPPHPKEIITRLLKSSRLPQKHQALLVELANGRAGLVKSIVNNQSFAEVKTAIIELSDLLTSDLEGRFRYAQKMSDEKSRQPLARKVLYWILYCRTRLARQNFAEQNLGGLGEPKTGRLLKNLLTLQNTLSQPQFNQRLALENFLVKM